MCKAYQRLKLYDGFRFVFVILLWTFAPLCACRIIRDARDFETNESALNGPFGYLFTFLRPARVYRIWSFILLLYSSFVRFMFVYRYSFRPRPTSNLYTSIDLRLPNLEAHGGIISCAFSAKVRNNFGINIFWGTLGAYFWCLIYAPYDIDKRGKHNFWNWS